MVCSILWARTTTDFLWPFRMVSASNVALSAQRVRAAAWANSHSSLLTQALPLRMRPALRLPALLLLPGQMPPHWPARLQPTLAIEHLLHGPAHNQGFDLDSRALSEDVGHQHVDANARVHRHLVPPVMPPREAGASAPVG